jgi:hypothetical protein
VETLRQQIQRLEKSWPSDGEAVTTRSPAIDRLLPGRGWQRGTLVEWLIPWHGSGALGLTLALGRELAAAGGLIVVSDPLREFYPPAAAAFGYAPAQFVVLHPADAAEELWALDQALRCRGVACVWAHLARLGDHDFRRLQLAAETGGTVGFLSRPPQVRGQPSWSDVQLRIQPVATGGNRRFQVQVVRVRGGVAGASVIVEIDDLTGAVGEVIERHETHFMPSLPWLAAPTARSRPA